MLVLYFIFLANIFCTSSFHGASFPNSFWAVLAFGRFSNKKFKYLYTFRSYAFAISIIVKQIALALAPSTESQNNQFFLPTVIGRIAFSLRLLLSGSGCRSHPGQDDFLWQVSVHQAMTKKPQLSTSSISFTLLS